MGGYRKKVLPPQHLTTHDQRVRNGLPRYTIQEVLAEMVSVGNRLAALERKRAAQQTPAQQTPQPPTTQTQDAAMTRDPRLAPTRHITFDADAKRPPSRTTRDARDPDAAWRFGSVAQALAISDMLKGEAGPPCANELNTSRFWKHGPQRDDDMGMRSLAEQARAGNATTATPYELNGGQNSQLAQRGRNVSGGTVAASHPSNDPSAAFASELNKIPNGQMAAGLNLFNAAYHSEKRPEARERLEEVFKAWQGRATSGDTHAMTPSGKLAEHDAQAQALHDASPWSNLYAANKATIGANPNMIHPGQKLDLGGGQTHVVAAGENLSTIAAKYGSGGSSTIHPLAAEPHSGAIPTDNPREDYSKPAPSAPTPPSRPSSFPSTPTPAYGGSHEPSQAATVAASGGGSMPRPQPSNPPTPPSRPSSFGSAPSSAPTPPARPAGIGEPGAAASANVQRMLRE